MAFLFNILLIIFYDFGDDVIRIEWPELSAVARYWCCVRRLCDHLDMNTFLFTPHNMNRKFQMK